MRRLILTATFLAAVAVPAAAQDSVRTRERDRDREETMRGFMLRGMPGSFSMSMRRERIGVLLDLTADPSRDSIGARVAGVTPGGPADRAGVHTGDLIVRFNGTRLAALRADQRGDADSEQSAPGLRLIELAARLDGGDSVRLELRRDGRPVTVSLVASESGLDRVLSLNGDQLHRFEFPFPPEMSLPGGSARINVITGAGEGLADLELVRVNSGLSEYFGTADGLLVVDVGGDSTLGLRAGDVILSIGGRRPTSPAHAIRILSTYDANEAVQFEVMRQKRRATVSGRMPQRREGSWRIRSNSFEMEPGMELPRVARIRISEKT
jgi:hypothetical protein